ncbi:MAG: hypothetical protein ABSC25_17935 [Roseiarcus sp.]|jgi:hypothetical protein
MQGDKKKRSTICAFQKTIVGVGKRRRFPRHSAAFPSTEKQYEHRSARDERAIAASTEKQRDLAAAGGRVA